MHSEKVIQKNEMGEEIQINIHVASHRCCPPHLRCTEPEPGLPYNLTHIKPSISGEYECLQDIISDTVFFLKIIPLLPPFEKLTLIRIMAINAN